MDKNRLMAMKWWNYKLENQKYNILNSTELMGRSTHTLTGREIQELWEEFGKGDDKKSLGCWKKDAEEDYGLDIPTSVLKYISELEKAVEEKHKHPHTVNGEKTVAGLAFDLGLLKGELQDKPVKVLSKNGELFSPEIKFILKDKYNIWDKSKDNVDAIHLGL